MSETAVSSQSLQNKEQIILSLRKMVRNNLNNLKFLLAWYEIMGEEKREFGFNNAIGFGPQSDLALEYLLKTQRDWYKMVLNYGETMDFEDYFLLKAKDLGLVLPVDFKQKIQKKMEELEK